MEVINVNGKNFTISLPEEKILGEISRIGAEISRDMEGRELLFVCVLNGAFMFAADLLKHITVPCEISFIRVASYEGMESSGTVKEIIGLTQTLKGKSVVIIEDIIDSGLTIQYLLEQIRSKGADDLRIASLLVKQDNLQVPLDIAYSCFNIPNDFIVGYGLDYNGYGRNLRNIYTVVE